MLDAIIEVSYENVQDRHVTQPLWSREEFHKDTWVEFEKKIVDYLGTESQKGTPAWETVMLKTTQYFQVGNGLRQEVR